MDREKMLEELHKLYETLDELHKKRTEAKEQRVRISNRIKKILQSLLEDLGED